jgi:hypothetical protein
MLHELADLGVVRFTPQAGANDGAATTPVQALVPAAAMAAAAANAMPNPAAKPGVSGLRAVAIACEDPTTLSVEHWRRRLEGERYTASSRIE